MRLTLFCPSRGRPAEARALKASFDQTKATLDAELVFLLDDDDPTRHDYPRYGYGGYGDGLLIATGTGDPTGPLNRAVAGSKSDIVGFCGDDSRPETLGWDLEVMGSLKEPGFCWAMDGTNPNPWPSTCFVNRVIPQTLGWFVLPGLRRGYFDVVWAELARLTHSARLLPGVMIRHDNSAGDPHSPNYVPERQVPPEIIAADQRVFEAWMRDDARTDAQRLRRALYVS